MESLTLRRQLNILKEMTGIPWSVIEQDYVLSCILFGISKIERLSSTLVFKGGTALKKCYFGDYRFSQDLDFSVQGISPRGEELLSLVSEACQIAADTTDTIEFQCKRYPEKNAHPEEQEAISIHAKLPWQRDYITPVKIEVTVREKVILSPEKRVIIHGYDKILDSTIYSYQLEEIIAEKIRAILQFAKKLHERGWGRSRVRDYYDLWRIFGHYSDQIDKSALPELVSKKCSIKSVEFKCVDDLFDSRLMESLVEWNRWLSPLVPDVPDKEEVIFDLKMQLRNIFGE